MSEDLYDLNDLEPEFRLTPLKLSGSCHTCGSKELEGAQLHISTAGVNADYLIACAACHQKAAAALAINRLINQLKCNPDLILALREVLGVVS